MTVEPQSAWQRLLEIVVNSILIAILVGGAFVARRNIRLGRGDRKGATRLAAFVLTTVLMAWLLQVHHLSEGSEIFSFFRMLSFGLLFAAVTWTFYLALEPFLRRLWPEMIVSWVRLLDGRFRDPLVGRDVLVGLLVAAALALVTRSMVVASCVGLVPHRPDQVGPPIEIEMSNLAGLRDSIGNLGAVPAASLIISLGLMTLLLLCRLVLRKRWLAMGAWSIVRFRCPRPAVWRSMRLWSSGSVPPPARSSGAWPGAPAARSGRGTPEKAHEARARAAGTAAGSEQTTGTLREGAPG